MAVSYKTIPDSVIKAIARKQPLRAVFRNSSFANSPSKINVGEIFKMLAPDTRVKVIWETLFPQFRKNSEKGLLLEKGKQVAIC